MRHAAGGRYGGALTVALLAALLLCHGLTGPAHPHSGAATEGEAYAPGVEMGVAAGHGEVPGAMDCYVSVLLAVALGLPLLAKLARSRAASFTPEAAPPVPTRGWIVPSRPPDLAFLGVFRQ